MAGDANNDTADKADEARPDKADTAARRVAFERTVSGAGVAGAVAVVRPLGEVVGHCVGPDLRAVERR